MQETHTTVNEVSTQKKLTTYSSERNSQSINHQLAHIQDPITRSNKRLELCMIKSAIARIHLNSTTNRQHIVYVCYLFDLAPNKYPKFSFPSIQSASQNIIILPTSSIWILYFIGKFVISQSNYLIC